MWRYRTINQLKQSWPSVGGINISAAEASCIYCIRSSCFHRLEIKNKKILHVVSFKTSPAGLKTYLKACSSSDGVPTIASFQFLIRDPTRFCMRDPSWRVRPSDHRVSRKHVHQGITRSCKWTQRVRWWVIITLCKVQDRDGKSTQKYLF